MLKNLPMVTRVVYGRGAFDGLDRILGERRNGKSSFVYLVDQVFEDHRLAGRLPVREDDHLVWVSAKEEPKTCYADCLTEQVRGLGGDALCGVVGVGGGTVLDLAKAVSLMLTNPGSSADYQGWDLVRNPGVYHVGVPTLAGTGSEVSRTAVLTGPEKKLGLNSDHTVFDQIVLDPQLIEDAPETQRFYTGMDCFIHCIESLQGAFGNAFSEAYGEKGLELCRRAFHKPPSREVADELLMLASYCGGMSIGYSQVGAAHALSYGLSYVLGLRHGVANCIAFDQLDEFYPEGVEEFRGLADENRVEIPREVTRGLSASEMDRMVSVALGLAPLWENAVGPNWRDEISRARVKELYCRM